MNRMEIERESKRLGEQFQFKRDVTEHFLSEVVNVNVSDGVVLSTLAEVIKKYCEMRGIKAEEFAKDLAVSVELMAKYYY